MSTQPEFLYKIQPTRLVMLSEGPTQRESDIVAQYFDYLKNLLDEGTLILAGRTQNSDASSFGIVIFRAAMEAEAQKIMESDPTVQQDVMRAELYPYRVALVEGLSP